METEDLQEQENEVFATFKDQLFTSTQISSFTGISRREIHDIINNKSIDLSPTTIPHGKKEKLLFAWNDYKKLVALSKKKKTISKKVKVVINAKGGVGKTAVASMVTHEACYQGLKTLAIDLDPQGQFTYNLGLSSYNGKTFKDLISADGRANKIPITDIIQPITPLLDIIPSCIGLNGVELILKNRMTRSELVLKEAIDLVYDNYDLILIDTNPYVSLTFVNAIMAADHLLIPVLTDFNSHMGLDYMMQILDELFAGQENSNNKTISIIPNSYDVRNNISKESLNVLRENFGKNLTEAKIRLSTDISQAAKMQQSLRQYKKSSNVLSDITDLTEEIFK